MLYVRLKMLIDDDDLRQQKSSDLLKIGLGLNFIQTLKFVEIISNVEIKIFKQTLYSKPPFNIFKWPEAFY